MDNLFSTIAAEPQLSSLVSCAIIHYQFEAIHPFEDGNGRMGRLMIPLYLMSKNILDRPHLYLSAFFAANLGQYVNLMKRVSTHGDWEEWLVFFLEAVRTQSDELKGRARTIVSIHKTYKERVRVSKNRQQAALSSIDLIMERVFVTVRDIADFARCTKPTAASALDSLERLGIVSIVPGRYPRTWAAYEYLDKIYGQES